MGKYDVDASMERDASGRIMRAGARWEQSSPFFDWIAMKGSLLGVGLLLVGMMFALLLGGFNYFLLLGAIVLGGSILLLIGGPTRTRALYFYADGRMETPYGIPYHPSQREIGGNHEHLTSIEARPDPDQSQDRAERLFQVVMLSRSGSLIFVSDNLPETVAMRVAAQLTIALLTIRREQADGAGYGWAEVA